MPYALCLFFTHFWSNHFWVKSIESRKHEGTKVNTCYRLMSPTKDSTTKSTKYTKRRSLKGYMREPRAQKYASLSLCSRFPHAPLKRTSLRVLRGSIFLSVKSVCPASAGPVPRIVCVGPRPSAVNLLFFLCELSALCGKLLCSWWDKKLATNLPAMIGNCHLFK